MVIIQEKEEETKISLNINKQVIEEMKIHKHNLNNIYIMFDYTLMIYVNQTMSHFTVLVIIITINKLL